MGSREPHSTGQWTELLRAQGVSAWGPARLLHYLSLPYLSYLISVYPFFWGLGGLGWLFSVFLMVVEGPVSGPLLPALSNQEIGL